MKLHINVDHVATLRQARGTRYPDPAWAASLCELAGCDGITIHLREDRRHIQDRDLRVLRETTRGALNLEMAATEEMVAIAIDAKPDVVTLVPEKRQERTTEGGLDVAGVGRAATEKAIAKLTAAGIPVSLFIDPAEASVRISRELGAPRVELHTGDYCEAWGPLDDGHLPSRARDELVRIEKAAQTGLALGMHVAAGHGLDYGNVGPIAAIAAIEELNIGHAIIARAVMVGMERAVREMRDAMNEARA